MITCLLRVKLWKGSGNVNSVLLHFDISFVVHHCSLLKGNGCKNELLNV